MKKPCQTRPDQAFGSLCRKQRQPLHPALCRHSRRGLALPYLHRLHLVKKAPFEAGEEKIGDPGSGVLEHQPECRRTLSQKFFGKMAYAATRSGIPVQILEKPRLGISPGAQGEPGDGAPWRPPRKSCWTGETHSECCPKAWTGAGVSSSAHPTDGSLAIITL